MDSQRLIRDAIELLIVIAVGGMLWTVISRLRSGRIRVVRCLECHRPTSRAYPVCKWCGAPWPEDA